jgi:hypothetical protein
MFVFGANNHSQQRRARLALGWLRSGPRQMEASLLRGTFFPICKHYLSTTRVPRTKYRVFSSFELRLLDVQRCTTREDVLLTTPLPLSTFHQSRRLRRNRRFLYAWRPGSWAR